ncbi:HEPN domain-containing protein [Oscillatoria sp. CS-180]|uniref:HEPN domain-containing protein n=1 Tax=Oscillatoria sp. CS-180 TaxID=3021720 RepID=UPI00232F0197|nr:HEPN domain-containing protein [Oscillatoria sp. CS-180]MDB9527469.1 HEPN domain-containing protein [Oscillatoria sp. CS-180]
MKNQRDLATGWFRKGDSDLTTAQLVLASDGPYDTACYHAQQAAEKYLKGFLAYRGMAIPRIHDLLELNQLCVNAAKTWLVKVDNLAELMPYAVESRYDLEFFPDQETASEALDLAQQVKVAVLNAIPP